MGIRRDGRGNQAGARTTWSASAPRKPRDTSYADLQNASQRRPIPTHHRRIRISISVDVEDVLRGEVDFAQLMKLYGDYGQHDSEGEVLPTTQSSEVISKVRDGDPTLTTSALRTSSGRT